ncbi:MAG: ATP-binding cassette domain-containing protein [Planctomycetota bacterium]|jgi:oligopeptide transport system ATP-binding protein|nr:ATP-binding cassette domain-containing protein [Planctomycetota bacterium]
MSEPLLQVDDLVVSFTGARRGWFGPRSELRAVDGVSFSVAPGEVLGLVGESGCGKSTTARAICRLVAPHSGRVRFAGTDLLTLTGSALRTARRGLQMVFQDPFASLDPRYTCRRIIAEPLEGFGLASGEQARQRVDQLMQQVGLDPSMADRYPHEFSGGQRQRIGIARALAAEPQVLLCDEPVSALDVSVQAQIINLLLELRRELGLAMVFIAHDLAVVRHVADRIAVMYAGRIVEQAPADTLFANPRHPYTEALLAAIPIPDPTAPAIISQISGEPPSPHQAWAGHCAFAPRCPHATEACHSGAPELITEADGRIHRCPPRQA